MKKFLVALISVLLLCTMFVGCSANINDTSDTFTIYAEAGTLDKDTIETGFNEYYREKVGKEVKTQVLFYEDTDKMMKDVKDGKVVCDLILTKDYAAQVLIKDKNVQGIFDESEVANKIAGYKNISSYIQELNTKVEKGKENANKVYSIPFSFRTQGTLYNRKNISETDATSLTIYSDSALKGKIVLNNNYRQLYSLGTIYANYNTIESSDDMTKALNDAMNNLDYLNRENSKDQLKKLEKNAAFAYAKNSAELVLEGKKDVALCWSNQAVKAIANNTNKNIKLSFKIPQEGSIIETNSFVMPNKANNKQEAEFFLNYILQDEVSISQMNYSGNSSVLATKKLLNELEDTSMRALDYRYFFGYDKDLLTLKNGYYPTVDEADILVMVQDMGDAKEDVIGMINGIVSNTLLIVLLVIIGVIIVGVAIFLIFFVTKKSKQKANKKEKLENSKGYRK